ncbi:hypothetical protein CARN8_1510002 [mine drainage metagenome]|uniref:Uncharacterized protein n=1 Tax=mine drainage metagenome TaxID=410659 RepID=A0A3P3ZLR1_9ZZZZ
MAFYSGKNGLTRKLQQHDGAVEFQLKDRVRINNVPCVVYEARRYNPDGGWEFVGRVEVEAGRDVMNRVSDRYDFLGHGVDQTGHNLTPVFVRM